MVLLLEPETWSVLRKQLETLYGDTTFVWSKLLKSDPLYYLLNVKMKGCKNRLTLLIGLPLLSTLSASTTLLGNITIQLAIPTL